MKKLLAYAILSTPLFSGAALASESQEYRDCQANAHCRAVGPTMLNRAFVVRTYAPNCDAVARNTYDACYTGGGAGQDMYCASLAADAQAQCEARQ